MLSVTETNRKRSFEQMMEMALKGEEIPYIDVIPSAGNGKTAMAMIGNELGTASYLQAQVPEKSLGAATGFVYGFARAMTMLSLLGCGWLFDALGPMNGILAMAVLFTLIAPVYFFSSRRFADQKMPGDAVPSGD